MPLEEEDWLPRFEWALIYIPTVVYIYRYIDGRDEEDVDKEDLLTSLTSPRCGAWM